MEERGVLLHNFTTEGDRVSVFERHRLTPRGQGSGTVPDRHRRQELQRHAAAEAAGIHLQVRILSGSVRSQDEHAAELLDTTLDRGTHSRTCRLETPRTCMDGMLVSLRHLRDAFLPASSCFSQKLAGERPQSPAWTA